MTLESRRVPLPPKLAAGAANRLVGYAARFNSPSEVLSERGRVFREVIRPGAFAAALAARSVVALWNHGTDGRPPLGRTPTTLRLAEDADGLRFELDLPESAADVREAVARGDVGGMSFGFPNRTAMDAWSYRDGTHWRDLIAVDLREISVVIDPAYRATSVEVRDSSAVVVPDAPAPDLSRFRLMLAERE